jgi:peptidoglycan L-alanyl-D-glutamate endopeptidase CwlK
MIINRNFSLLFPDFRRRLIQGLWLARKAGLHAYLFEGYRGEARQAALYAQGRTLPGSKVTWVKAGFSFHNYGLAGDIVFDGNSKPGVQWSWEGDYADLYKDDYAKLAEILKGVGLDWLGDSGVERAHFQHKTSYKTSDMKKIVEVQGLLGLWQLLYDEQREKLR